MTEPRTPLLSGDVRYQNLFRNLARDTQTVSAALQKCAQTNVANKDLARNCVATTPALPAAMYDEPRTRTVDSDCKWVLDRRETTVLGQPRCEAMILDTLSVAGKCFRRCRNPQFTFWPSCGSTMNQMLRKDEFHFRANELLNRVRFS